MTPSDVADLFYSHPDALFRLTLNSGDTIDVLKPRQSIVDFTGILHVGVYANPESRIAARMQYISVMNIAMIERIDSHAPRGRRGK